MKRQNNHDMSIANEGIMDLKAAAKEKLDAIRERIVELSHRIHACPELGFKEEQSSVWISEFLSREGFIVET